MKWDLFPVFLVDDEDFSHVILQQTTRVADVDGCFCCVVVVGVLLGYCWSVVGVLLECWGIVGVAVGVAVGVLLGWLLGCCWNVIVVIVGVLLGWF